METTWREAVMAYFDILALICLDENHVNLQS
jgi:hypothetical protein